jgi:uncharacterized protein (TIGR03435 family)
VNGCFVAFLQHFNPAGVEIADAGDREDGVPRSYHNAIARLHPMSRAQKISITSVLAVMVGVAVMVKLIWFPGVKESYFTTNVQMLRQVPTGLVAVRPTHFPTKARKGVMTDSVMVAGKPVRRMMGRNVTFRELIAAAYGSTRTRVVLPADAPGTNFDFVVTVQGDLQQSLQTAIRKQLGYSAQVEKRNTEALAVKVVDAGLPGLKVSTAAASSVKFDNGRYYFTHAQPGFVATRYEETLKLPVTDKTGLTNYYDFSIDWSLQTQREMRDEQTSAAVVKRFVAGWGLALEPDPDPVEMLVVTKVK